MPIVSTVRDGKKYEITQVAAVTIIIEINAPGSFCEILGVRIIMSNDTIPTARVYKSIFPRFERYIPHLGINSPGTFSSPSPKKSFI